MIAAEPRYGANGTMNEFAAIAMSYESKNLAIEHIPGPQGACGRKSDKIMIKDKIGWEPSTSIEKGYGKHIFDQESG